MRVSRPLEFYSDGRLLFVVFLGGNKGERGGATDATDRALNLPMGAPLTYPDIQRTPYLSTWGSRFKNKPAMTYSPTPSKVQYHRREES